MTPILPIDITFLGDTGCWQPIGLESRGQRNFQITGSLKYDYRRSETSDVADGYSKTTAVNMGTDKTVTASFATSIL